MNILKYLYHPTHSKFLIILISASLIFYSNCSGSRIKRISEPPDKFHLNQDSENFPYLKLHINNGELYVLENWKMNASKDSISGSGKLFNPNRELVSDGQFKVPVKNISLVETNQIGSSAGVGALATLSVITGIFTIVCIANPKACFGSCPTFYTYNGTDFIVQSEGFSSSILPCMEECDIDALYRVKPIDRNLQIQLRNEAYETHIIRSANILALQKPNEGRVFSTADGNFFQATNLSDAISVTANEGDISEKLCSFDGIERFSMADSNDLSAREIIEAEFYKPNSDCAGIVIAARQTLLTTFLFYQTLSFMGSDAGYWLSNIERNPNQLKPMLENARSVLGNIDVLVQNENGDWEKIGEVGEAGPISTDIKIVPLPKNLNFASNNSSVKIRLKMSKGLWRIDYLAIADIGDKVAPVVIPPSSASPEFINNSKVVKLLTDSDSVLLTYPGDKYIINYQLPSDFDNYELFMESQGYYLEWMRNEWLGEENTQKVYQMILDPKQYYKDLAPEFKKIESEMEQTFWSSKYVLP